MKKISFLFLSVLFLTTSCIDEIVDVEYTASSSNSTCTVWTDDYTTNDGDFDKIVRIYGNFSGVTPATDDCGQFFKLGFIVTENSQNPGRVYALVNPNTNTWRRLNECRSKGIAGFWDGLSKNESKNAVIRQEGTNKGKVYLFFGNTSKYQLFAVDNGEGPKAKEWVRTLPSGFKGNTLFYHNYNRADFPPSFLGIKGKKLYNFGNNLRKTPTLVPVRKGSTNVNGKVQRVEGYWPHSKKKIVLRLDGNKTITVGKERGGGVNFYKD
ncbi:MAG: hypothetical protein AAF705_06205 [Bacteroidota bacterium]